MVYATFTKKQLFDDSRYYFPGLKINMNISDIFRVRGRKVPVDKYSPEECGHQ